jgi:ferredoxin
LKLTLEPSGEVLDVNGEQSLFEQLTKAGKKIKSSCGGTGSCSDCVVIIKEGEEHMNPPGFEEIRLLGNVFHITKERLSCQVRVTGSVTIDISGHEKKSKSKSAPVPKSPSVIVRKKEELQETASKSQEKDSEKKADAWYRHWEKPDVAEGTLPRKLGGGKRPRPFNTDNDPDEGKE